MGVESYHVISNAESGWNAVRYGSCRASGVFSSFLDARDYAMLEAKIHKCGLVLHDERGEIQNPDDFRYHQMILPMEQEEKESIRGKPVFINCTEEGRCEPFLQVILFTLIMLGFHPKVPLESYEKEKFRLEHILSLLDECDISIYDISRIRNKQEPDSHRLNMAFELGMDLGSLRYGQERKNKKILMIGDLPCGYMKVLSDLPGASIRFHHNRMLRLIETLRHWFEENLDMTGIPGPMEIWYQYHFFNKYYLMNRFDKGFSGRDRCTLPLQDKMRMMSRFLRVSQNGSCRQEETGTGATLHAAPRFLAAGEKIWGKGKL